MRGCDAPDNAQDQHNQSIKKLNINLNHHSSMRALLFRLSSNMQRLFILTLVLNGICGQPFPSGSSTNVGFISDYAATRAPPFEASTRSRNRHMYAMCPPNFQRAGTECYHLSDQLNSWLEAHFYCKEKNAKLAEPQKYADRKLRTYLQNLDEKLHRTDPIWIGATYDWQSNIWQWSISGRNLTYDAFIRNNERIRNTLENHCAVYDPTIKYRWSARSCPDRYRFLCQHKMPKVSAKNRYKVYDRWNATYPNQYANEVILEVIDRRGKNGERSNQRVRAVDSNEDIVLYNHRPSRHRKRPLQRNEPSNLVLGPDHTRTTNRWESEPVSPKTVPRPDRDGQRTQHDRKLQRQREKEQKRLLRKRERQQRMRQEKLQRIRERQRKHNHYTTASTTSTTSTTAAPLPATFDRESPVANLATPTRFQHQLSDEGVRKQREQQNETNDRHDDHDQPEEMKHLENPDQPPDVDMAESRSERERYMKEMQETVRLRNEQSRRQFELEEKRRQDEIARAQAEEEKRLELLSLEEARRLEREELARLEEENRIREENQRRRAEEIARLQDEQRRMEEEEQRIRQELEEAERQRQREHEDIIKREEEQLRAKEERKRLEEEEQNRLRNERLEILKRQENERVRMVQEQKRRAYAERLAKLSPEDQKRFFELRKLRKSRKMSSQQEN